MATGLSREFSKSEISLEKNNHSFLKHIGNKIKLSMSPKVSVNPEEDAFKKSLKTWVKKCRDGSKKEDREKAQALILRCFEKNHSILLLNQLNLYSIPPLHKLTQLRILRLDRNNIEKIQDQDLVHLQNLETLDLRFNRLKNCNGLSKLPNLVSLDLSKNSITSIDKLNTSKMTKLEWLDLSVNNLSSIQNLDLSQCSKLCNLCIMHNKLEKFDCTLPIKFNPNLDIFIRENNFSRTYIDSLTDAQKDQNYEGFRFFIE